MPNYASRVENLLLLYVRYQFVVARCPKRVDCEHTLKKCQNIQTNQNGKDAMKCCVKDSKVTSGPACVKFESANKQRWIAERISDRMACDNFRVILTKI